MLYCESVVLAVSLIDIICGDFLIFSFYAMTAEWQLLCVQELVEVVLSSSVDKADRDFTLQTLLAKNFAWPVMD